MAKAATKVTNEALARAIAECKEVYGKDTVRTYDQQADVEIIPTPFYELNQASSLGGIPLGKIIEIFGEFSSGKTTLSWQVAAALQRATGKKILFLDYEGATSKPYLKKLGVNVEEVFFGQPDKASLEDGFGMINKLIPTGAFCCVVVDSFAAMVPKSELNSIEEKGLEGADLALKAKIMHKAMRYYSPFVREHNIALIFINHVMQKINLQGGYMAQLGEQEETPGGKALKFYSDLRIQLKPMEFVNKQVPSEKDPKKKVNVKIGRSIKLKFVKNRVGEPFGEAVMTLRNGQGFDVATSAIKRGIAEGIIIKKTGGIHQLKDDEKIQASSYDKFWNLVIANPKLLQDILSKLEGKEVKFQSVDMSAAERDLSAEELGISSEEIEQITESILDV